MNTDVEDSVQESTPPEPTAENSPNNPAESMPEVTTETTTEMNPETTTEVAAEAETEVAVEPTPEVIAEIKPEAPVDTKTTAAADPPNVFSNFELRPEVLEAVKTEGYTTPTEIQSQTIPLILEGRDVIGQANTGTGKTAAFALPLLSRIDPHLHKPQVVVLAPTRELAIQVAEAFEVYAQNLPQIKVATIYGGQSYGIQISQLKRGAQIVVGTPGRVIDHMKRDKLKLDNIATFVLDEADEMLNMGFADDVQWIMGELPAERQTLLFSATMPQKLRRIVELYLNDPENITSSKKTLTTSTVTQRACIVPPREKLRLLARILESEQTDGVIVFVKTKEMSSRLAENLCQRGFQASALNGDMAQQQRERTVERLKDGRLNILVATDVAARGLDVDRITHVINYDYPTENEAYVHRIGRTGRARREGKAILFVGPRERNQVNYLQKVTGQKVTWMLQPTNEEINAQRAVTLKTQLAKEIARGKLDEPTEVVQEFLAENPEATIEQVAAGLAQMIMRKREVEGDNFKSKDRKPRHERGSRKFDGERGRGKRGDRFDKRGGRDRDSGRFERGGRDQGARGNGPGKRSSDYMVKYRIEVGYVHGVKPGNIVGAMTSESGLRGSDIGGIDINTNFTTVDLPAGLSQGVLQSLSNLRVAGQALRIREWNRRGPGKFDEKPRKFNRRKDGKPSWKKHRKPVAK